MDSSSVSLAAAPSESLKLLLQEQPSGVTFVEGSSELATSAFVRATLASRPCVVYLSLDTHLAHSPEGLVRYLASSLGIYTVSSYCSLRELLGASMATREDVDYWTRAVVAMLTEALRAIRARDDKHFYPPTILVAHLDRFLEEVLAQGRLTPMGDNLVMHAAVSFLSALEALAEQGLVHVVIPQAAGEALRRSSAPGLLDAAWAHSRGRGRVSPASGASADEFTGPRVFTLRQLHVDEVESFLWAQIFHPKSFDADTWRHRNVEELRNIKFSVAYESFKASRPADFAAIVAISELLLGNQSLIERYVSTVRTMAAERLVAASLTLDPRYGAVPEPASSGAGEAKLIAPTDIIDYVNPDVLRRAFCRLVDHQSHSAARALMEMLSKPNEVSLVPPAARSAGPLPPPEQGESVKKTADHVAKLPNDDVIAPIASSEECFLGDQIQPKIDSSSASARGPSSAVAQRGGREREADEDASLLDTDAYDRLFDRSQDGGGVSVSESLGDPNPNGLGKVHHYSSSPSSNASGGILDSLLRSLFKKLDDESSAAAEVQKSLIRDGYDRWSRAVMRGIAGRKHLAAAGSEETDTSMYDSDASPADASAPLTDRMLMVGKTKTAERSPHGAVHSEGPTRSWRLQLKYLLRALIDMSLHSAHSASSVAASPAVGSPNPSSVRVPIWQFVAEYLHGDPELLWFMLDNRLIRLTPVQPMHERNEEEHSFRDADRSAHIQGFSFPLDSAQHVYQVEFYSPMVRRAIESLLLDGANHLQDVLTAKVPAQPNYRSHHRLTQTSRDHRASRSLKGTSGESALYSMRGISVIGYEGRGSNRSKDASTADSPRAGLTYSMKESPFLSSTDRAFLASCDSKLQRVSSCDLQFLDDMEMGLARGAGLLLGVCGDLAPLGPIPGSASSPSAMSQAPATATGSNAELNKLAEKRLIQLSLIHGGECMPYSV
jgi:hypothetical protein